MKEELYKKVGRRYVQVNDPWAYDGLQEGHHHVWVRPGSVTIREFILPDKQGVTAAIEEVREGMVAAMQEANKSTPRNRSLSVKETRAIRAYREVMGEDAEMIFEGISMWDLVEAGIKVLVNHYNGD